MRVDEDTIKHVAAVARLELTPEEVKRFLPELKEILEIFSKLDSVDTDPVTPSFQPVALKDNLREDEIRRCFTQEEALKNNTQNKDGYIKGPKAV